MEANSCACYGSNDIHECFCNLNKNNMKNIHLLSTDNPSRLFEIDGHLIINKEQLIQPKYYRNIYITSDDEIKMDDWYLDDTNSVRQAITECESYWTHRKKYQKIILTTDQDLIADGVQAIDDEFLEWFVKNPTTTNNLNKLNYETKR
jgi:hypothetical protein